MAVEEEIEDLANVIANAKKPLVIVGGGVRYSEAGEEVEKFCEEFKIPFGETQGEKVHVNQVIHTAWEESVLQVLMHPMFLQKMRM